MSRTSVDLPDPDTPVIAHEAAERDVDRDVAQVVLACAVDRRASRAWARAAAAGSGIDLRPDRYWPVIDSLTFIDALHRSAVDDLAAVLAGPGTDVDDPVALADRLLVVLDDDHRVAEVA